MSDPRLQRLEDLFQRAADLPADERAAFLASACADDADLRAHVERLLARHDAGLSLPAAGAPSASPGETPGTLVGRYRLLRVLGEGGFGVVWEAEQSEPVRRRVALKIVKPGMDSREVVERFARERQALALMDHPDVAKVLDGGTTDAGRPYFVMELVDGQPITDFCDAHALDTSERLLLFERVCRAVQHAHLKGIVHRDLKPGNVLVLRGDDGRPQPRVIDFGVSKALSGPLDGHTLVTRAEQLLGTPAYMSPEQASVGAPDVDIRTDVYSLGVLLYELLTGSTPFDSRTLLRAGLAEVQRVLREVDPPRPSQRISTTLDAEAARARGCDVPRLLERVRGELDWIVMKALEKDRARRYQSAADLADDVRRHLRDEPVLAGPESAAYRVRKLLRRHRAAVLVASVVLLLLVLGIVGTTSGMLEARRQAEVAERNADVARENAATAQRNADDAHTVLDFLVETLALADPSVALSPDVTVRTLLDRAAARLDALGEHPLAEARLRSTIGRAYRNLGEDARAEPHLRRAVELLATLSAAPDAVAPTTFDAGERYATLWALTNVAYYLDRGDAFAIAQEARRVGLGHVAASRPEAGAALLDFAQAVDAGAWSVEPDAMRDVPALFDAARAAVDAALAPGDPLWPIVADTFLAAGYTVWYTPHEPLGERFWDETLAIQRRELPPDHPDVAATVALLVGRDLATGRTEEADRLVRDALSALLRVHGDDELPVARMRSLLGQTLVAQGRFAEAEPLLLAGHAGIVQLVGDETSFLAVESLVRVIDLYDAWGRHEQARAQRLALARACAAGPYHPQWSVASAVFGPECVTLGELLAAFDRLAQGTHFRALAGTLAPEGVDAAAEALVAERRAALPDDDVRAVVAARVLLGQIAGLDAQACRAARESMASDAVAVLDGADAASPDARAEAHAALADALLRRGAADEARAQAELALAALADAPRGDVSWFVAAARVRTARVLLALGRADAARPILADAAETLAAQLGAAHEDTRAVRALLDEALAAGG